MTLRILHVIASMDPTSGGPPKVVQSLCSIGVEKGFSSAICTIGNSLSLPDDTIVYPNKGLKLYSFSPGLFIWLWRNMRSFDVVILHGLWNFTSIATVSAAFLTGARYVLMSHGMMDPWFLQRSRFSGLVRRIFWLWFERHVVERADAILFTCEEERRQAVRGYGEKWKHSFLVCLSVPDRFAPSPERHRSPSASSRANVLFLGRVDPKKGCEFIIRSMGGVTSMDLIVAGPVSSRYRSFLDTLAKSLGVGGRIKWLGMVQSEAKDLALLGASCFVLPSFQENFGLAVAEALSAGTPVVISNKVNIWPDIEAAGAGLICGCDTESVSQCLKVIEGLTDDEWLEMSKRARSLYSARYTPSVAARSFVAFMEEYHGSVRR